MIKKILKGTLVASTLYGIYDYNSKDQILTRNMRTLLSGLKILYYYKVKFDQDNISNVHETVARDLYHLCLFNDGLYIKFGQQVAASDHILPPQYLKYFAGMQDKARPAPYEDVKQIIREELGRDPGEIFESFDETPVAAASIAQVHKARLKTGQEVAVKIQKPSIQKQFKFDLKMQNLFFYVMEKIFDLPLLHISKQTQASLIKELDFRIESQNAKICKENFLKLGRGDIYVPEIHDQYTTKRTLIMEWVDGIKITDTKSLLAAQFDKKKLMKSIVEAFAEQIFISGFVHCDPHPGNIFVRRHPNDPRKHQIILLDFGLCIGLQKNFQLEYCRLWESIFLQNMHMVKTIISNWGMSDEQYFASATLMRPITKGKPISQGYSNKELYELQLKFKEDFRKLLGDTSKFPSELIFIGRNMNLVRSINKYMGSVVNRINIMAEYSVQGQHYRDHSASQVLKKLFFNFRLLLSNLVYNVAQVYFKVFESKTVEEKIDDQMKKMTKMAYEKYGIKPADTQTFNA